MSDTPAAPDDSSKQALDDLTAGYAHIGERLAARRMEKGLSLAQVEAEIRVRRQYLEAFEQMDTRRLPEGAYARGFLRTYARFLGFDPGQVSDAFTRDLTIGSHSGKRFTPPPERKGPKLQIPLRSIAGGGAFLCVGLLIWLGWPRDQDASPSIPPVTAQLREWAEQPPGAGVAESQLERLELSLRARVPAYLEVRRPGGHVLFEGVLAAGDVYAIPAGDTLISVDNGAALEILHLGDARGRLSPTSAPVSDWSPTSLLAQLEAQNAGADTEAGESGDPASPAQ